MTRRADLKASDGEQPCFSWIPEIPCFARQRASPCVQKEMKEVRPSSVRREHGSAVWGAGPDHAEMLHVAFPELPTARAFFDRFIADTADYTILEGDLPPWNEHMFTDNGELSRWSEEKTRKMSFLAYPVPPGWVPFKKYILRIEHFHSYQFVIDKSDGVELLQFEAQIHVNQEYSHVPFADCFTMRQLWTVRPVPAIEPGYPTVCQLNVTAELNFIGRPPLIAPVIRNRAYAEHRGGTQGWLSGARASIERLTNTDLESSVVNDLDTSTRSRHSKAEDGNMKVWGAGQWVCLMALLIFVLVVAFMTGRALGRSEVLATPATHPSGSDLSVNDLKILMTRHIQQ